MSLSRRSFVQTGTLAAASLPFAALLRSETSERSGTAEPFRPAALNTTPAAPGRATLTWLEGVPADQPGTALGVPWPRGTVKPGTPFALRSPDGANVPVQSWPLAFWPDGSLKWSGHALPAGAGRSPQLVLAPGHTPAAPAVPVVVRETPASVEINTGVITCVVPRSGPNLVSSLRRDGREIARNGRLLSLRQDQPDLVSPAESFTGETEKVTVEQSGPVRAVIRIDGRQKSDTGDRRWLPFTVRLYLHAGGDAVRIMHSFVYDGDEYKDFISGLGVRFEVPLPDAPHDRHIRFAGEDGGLFGEAVRGITGLRRDPGADVRKAQVAGLPTPPVDSWATSVSKSLHLIPAWGDYTLAQLSADGFEIRKRTKPGHGWIRSEAGRRSPGLGYVGGISGGLVFGVRDFWEKYPAQLDIRSAHTDTAEITAWLWSPEAQPMDLRFYHDGMGMETHAEELQGLDITYEDYEKDFGTPHGIARSHELIFRVAAATPAREEFPGFTEALRRPPQLAASPAHCHAAGVFSNWNLPDRSSDAKKRIEDQLDFLLKTYIAQPDQRHWYGFWDFGDVMHSYDGDRHEWRYDVGGFAWANSELSPDLWLWLSFLRSGRADVFRFAEAMTRHTGEVDVYHLGRFKGLGSRHNVQHWGCSAKQLRISTCAYRRFYYFLTADERTGDLMRELVGSDEAFLTLDPIRKIRTEPLPPPRRDAASVGFGTDWGSLAYAWLTEWERTGDTKIRDKLLAGMRTIAAQPHGFITDRTTFNLDTGEFSISTSDSIGVSHLSAVFGLPEICAELIELVDMPKFRDAWLQYCILYNASKEEQRAAVGADFGKLNLWEAHSRLTAYAAKEKKDPALAARAWKEFYAGKAGYGVRDNLVSTRVAGTDVLHPVDENFGLSTNATSQWGLAAIAMLALAGDPPAAK
jgi:hypothetical protein